MKGMKEWTPQEIKWYKELIFTLSYANLKEGYSKLPVTISKEYLENLKILLKFEEKANKFKTELIEEWIKEEENK